MARRGYVVGALGAAATALTCDGEADPPGSLPLTGRLEAARLCAIGPRHRRWTAPEPLADDLDGLAAALARLAPAPEDYAASRAAATTATTVRRVPDLEPEFWHPSPAAQRILDGLRR